MQSHRVKAEQEDLTLDQLRLLRGMVKELLSWVTEQSSTNGVSVCDQLRSSPELTSHPGYGPSGTF
jgi:hypothetical protein